MASSSRVGYSHTLLRAIDRENARKDGDYQKADAIRKELVDLGVRFDDASHTFTTSQGHKGGYSLHTGVGFQEVQNMCLEREEARRDSKYPEADQIRQQIQSFGATLDDRAHTFHMSDGAQGSYDLHRVGAQPIPAAPVPTGVPHARAQPIQSPAALNVAVRSAPTQLVAVRQAPVGAPAQHQAVVSRPQPPPLPPAPVPMLGGGAKAPSGRADGKFHGYLEALKLAVEREELRRARDYAGADRVRGLLQQKSVTVNDATHTFTVGGWEGTYDLHVGFTVREFQYVALEREEARRDRDYSRGDTLREWLVQHSVTLDDRTHTFTTPTGEAGSYDLYNWVPVVTDTSVPLEPVLKQPRR